MNDEAYRYFASLSQEEADLIFSTLLGYTINLVDHYSWRHGVMPAGIDSKDIVQQIVIKTITGKLTWDPCEVDLLTFMRNQVRREVTHLFVRKEYKRERHANEDEDFVEVVDRGTPTLEANESKIDCDPALWLEAIEDEQTKALAIQEYSDDLLEVCQGKPELEDVVYAILAGCEEKPRYLAEWLNIPVNEVNNRLKRLRSRADRVREKKVTS